MGWLPAEPHDSLRVWDKTIDFLDVNFAVDIKITIKII